MPESADFEGLETLVARVLTLPGTRVMVALAGPPGAGKSTLAAALADALNQTAPGSASVIPMDGFHYDDSVLEERGLHGRKGAPPTFDVGGLRHLLKRLRENTEIEVAVPVFDRKLEISRAGARIVAASVRTLIVEGNYLLLDLEPWTSLAPMFDLTAMLRTDRKILQDRLVQRWRSYGFSELEAQGKVAANDLPNVDLVHGYSRSADVIIGAAGEVRQAPVQRWAAT